MIIDFNELSANRIYHSMIQTLVPRPVAWVLSDNGGEASYNLAPFSYFTAVSSDPPLLMFSVGKKVDGSLKDTRKNILQRKKFVVHIAGVPFAEKVTASSASLAFGESELEHCDLAVEPFADFSLPRLVHCDIAYACELYEYQEIGNVPQGLIFGRIKQLYINDNVVDMSDNGRFKVDTQKLNPLARLGGNDYWVDGRVISVKRPS
ncbi:MAG: flavin reductase family protein [Pseudomonadales bacterium]|nr:flavin reductase family protein [Pseudomonadales bacterium]